MPVLPYLKFSPILLVITFLAGCGPRETAVESGIQTKTLHIGNGPEPQSLDPYVTTGSGDRTLHDVMFEGLVIPDPETGEPSPGVASYWDISEDQHIYTFHLRPEAKWSDGKPLIANDFVDSYRRVLAPRLAAEYANLFYYIVGAKAYNEGTETDFDTVGIKALDDHTLQLVLIHPIPHLLQLALGPAWLPVRVDVIEKFGKIDQRGTAWAQPGNLVGNGPFVLKEWHQNEVLIVEKSLHYWDSENVRLERIFFYPTDDVNTEERMFRSGQLHVSFALPLARLEPYRQSQEDQLWLKPEGRSRFLIINPEAEPFTDPKVRQALSLALNREAIASLVMKDTWIPAYNLIPDGLGGYTAGKQFDSDPVKARKLLAEAGFPDGEGFPEVSIMYPNQGNASFLLQALQEQWRSELGISVTISVLEKKVWLVAFKEGNYHISSDGWAWKHPHEFFELFVTGNLASYYLWSNAEYDRLFAESGKSLLLENRHSKYDQLENILAEEVPMIPLGFQKRMHLKHPSVKGWHENPYDDRPWKAIYLEAGE